MATELRFFVAVLFGYGGVWDVTGLKNGASELCSASLTPLSRKYGQVRQCKTKVERSDLEEDLSLIMKSRKLSRAMLLVNHANEATLVSAADRYQETFANTVQEESISLGGRNWQLPGSFLSEQQRLVLAVTVAGLVILLGLWYGCRSSAAKAALDPVADAVASASDAPGRAQGSRDVGSTVETGVQESASVVDYFLRTAQMFGPKLIKGKAACHDVVQRRLNNLRRRTHHIVVSELEGAAGDVCQIMDTPEIMLMAGQHDSRTEPTNFPPLAGLVRGALSPLMLGASLWSHSVQVLSILPILFLCAWAVAYDWSSVCRPMPLLQYWLAAMISIGLLLVLARLVMIVMIWRGQRDLQLKATEAAARVEEERVIYENEHGGEAEGEFNIGHLREMLIDYSVLSSTALLVDQNVSRSRWNGVVGFGTCVWVVCISWNIWEVFSWTFVPGLMSFDNTASRNYCAAWRSILVCRIVAMITGFIFLLNLGTLFFWVMGLLLHRDDFSTNVLRTARDFDKTTTHLPVAQLLVRAALMPSADVNQMHLADAQQQQRLLEKDIENSQKELCKMQKQLRQKSDEVAKFEKARDAAHEKCGGIPVEDHDVEAFERALRKTMDPHDWHQKGEENLRKVLESAPGEASFSMPPTENLQRLSAEVGNLAEKFHDSEAFQSMQAAAASGAERAMQATQDVQQRMHDSEALQRVQGVAAAGAERVMHAAQDVEQRVQDSEALQKVQSVAAAGAERVMHAAQDVEQRVQDSEALKEVAGASSKLVEGSEKPKKSKRR